MRLNLVFVHAKITTQFRLFLLRRPFGVALRESSVFGIEMNAKGFYGI